MNPLFPVIFQIILLNGRVCDHIADILQVTKVSEGSLVKFPFIGQKIKLLRISQQMIVQRQLSPVDDLVAVGKIDTVHSNKNLIQIELFQ